MGSAKFSGAHTVEVEGKEYNAKHILIATGGAPNKLGKVDITGVFSSPG
jgi:pyruvate/2-oxoglutarate dehydrogenase complex dihydrolipoamide dehydrogenase (E3) component